MAALGDRSGDLRAAATVTALRRAGGEVGAAAHLAAVDLGLVQTGAAAVRATGLTIAQLFLHADLDRQLSRAGAGDNGGIATLLVRLGDALAADPTGSVGWSPCRGALRSRLSPRLAAGDGHVLAAVPLPGPPVRTPTPGRPGSPPGVASAGCCASTGSTCCTCGWPRSAAWPRWRRPGSSASPWCSPWRPTRTPRSCALDRTGGLRRDNFGLVDEREHYWFRARLVQRLTDAAEHVALFPRPELARGPAGSAGRRRCRPNRSASRSYPKALTLT